MMDFFWEREAPKLLPALKTRAKSRKHRLLLEEATQETPNDMLWEDEEISVEPEQSSLPGQGNDESLPI